MKPRVRFASLVIALGLAGLLSSCASQSSSAAYRRQPVQEFEVVETSTKHQLSAREMAYLRAKVEEYLLQQGQTGSGDYYVKIFLGEDDEVEKGEWVVVRLTRYPSTRFSMLASYSTSYPSYPRYSYDYYPFGQFGFSALGFRYYDDPYYYGYGGSYPAWYHPRNGNWRDRHPDKDRDDDKNRPHHGYRPSGALKPSFIPTTVTERNRGNGTPSAFADRRRANRNDFQPRSDLQPGDDSWSRRREHQNRPSVPQPVNNYTPASEPTAPAAATNYRPATRSDLHRERGTPESGRPARPERTDSPRGQGSRERVYTPPARTESTDSARTQESPRQEQSRPADPPAARTDSSSEQTPRFHGGGYKKAE